MTIHSMTSQRPLSAFPTASDYQWCHIDRPHKNPRKMRTKNNDNTVRLDHFLNPDLRQYTEHFFDQFNLPMPTTDMIYRGNSQDLLFLNDYGLVIRTGPMNIIDMIHPAVLQPLYWLPFDNNNHVIALYPGIQVADHLYGLKRDNFDTDRKKLVSFMDMTGQRTRDAKVDQNFGYINNQLVVLDTENYFFGSKSPEITALKTKLFHDYIECGYAPHMAARAIMSELYVRNSPNEFQKSIVTFDAHQSLRADIHHAVNEENPETQKEKLNQFYNRCKGLTEKPEGIIQHKWHIRGQNGQKIWVKEDPVVTEQAALYRPWTGNPSDNLTKTGNYKQRHKYSALSNG